MRKPAFCTWESKGTYQLPGHEIADQRIYFRYIGSTIPLPPKFEISSLSAIFIGCTAWFVTELVRNPEDRFSRDMAHFTQCKN